MTRMTNNISGNTAAMVTHIHTSTNFAGKNVPSVKTPTPTSGMAPSPVDSPSETPTLAPEEVPTEIKEIMAYEMQRLKMAERAKREQARLAEELDNARKMREQKEAAQELQHSKPFEIKIGPQMFNKPQEARPTSGSSTSGKNKNKRDSATKQQPLAQSPQQKRHSATKQQSLTKPAQQPQSRPATPKQQLRGQKESQPVAPPQPQPQPTARQVAPNSKPALPPRPSTQSTQAAKQQRLAQDSKPSMAAQPKSHQGTRQMTTANGISTTIASPEKPVVYGPVNRPTSATNGSKPMVHGPANRPTSSTNGPSKSASNSTKTMVYGPVNRPMSPSKRQRTRTPKVNPETHFNPSLFTEPAGFATSPSAPPRYLRPTSGRGGKSRSNSTTRKLPAAELKRIAAQKKAGQAIHARRATLKKQRDANKEGFWMPEGAVGLSDVLEKVLFQAPSPSWIAACKVVGGIRRLHKAVSPQPKNTGKQDHSETAMRPESGTGLKRQKSAGKGQR
ncbi:hypothetical protein DFJ73DRAFT_852323 [Zopfochytrium polystomum]|nr:hypothetical protein DFJ73DRAFT_852323 [Zopfochytrium polystomum]